MGVSVNKHNVNALRGYTTRLPTDATLMSQRTDTVTLIIDVTASFKNVLELYLII